MVNEIISILVIFINITLALFVFFQNQKATSNRLFFILASLGLLWNIANFFTNTFESLFWLQTTFAAGALTLSSGLIWVLFITDNTLNRVKILIIILIGFVFFSASYLKGFITVFNNKLGPTNILLGSPGWGLSMYATFYFIVFFIIIFKLYFAKKNTKNSTDKKQFSYILIGSGITLLISSFSSFVVPYYFSKFISNTLDSIGFLIFLSFIAYTITRHNLFKIRVITVEMITVALWLIILSRVVLADNNTELVIDLGILLFAIIFGIILIRATLKEISQREEIEKLASDLKYLNASLEQKVQEQTADVIAAFELEKKTYKELERLNETKDQFIMITQHHLRTPVTTISWSLESVLKGDYGKVDEGVAKILDMAKIATKRLNRIVDDFLSITSIKIGTDIIKKSLVSIKPLVEDVISELKLEMEKLNITINYKNNDFNWPIISIDQDKIREVLLIVIENAVRYNFRNGNININTNNKNGFFEIIITNTGIGIGDQDKEKIFSSLFHRGNEAKNAHALGMGIGLSVSKAIINTHHGNISIHSDGINKGATVIIRLPIKE